MDLEKANDSETIMEFVLSVMSGNIPEYVLSEEIPSAHTHKYLKVGFSLIQKIVGKTFKELVIEPEKTFFLTLTAPWCYHCDLVNKRL